MAAEKDGSVIYQHPQSRLFSKMAMLVGFKDTLPTLQVEPKTAVGGEVRVLDRKLEEDEERLKKDNKRWRGIIYLTVAVCLIIFCLVLTQVITSITGSVRPLPNIDVSEPTAGRFAPRPEALVASLAAANRPVTVQPEPEAPRTVRAEVAVAEAQRAEKAEDAQAVVEDLQVELEVAEALSGSPESRSGYVAYVPAPVGGEREETSSSTAATTTSTTTTTTTTTTQPVTVARNRPFFMAMMFPKRPETVARRPPPFLPPRPSLTPPRPRPANQRPPFLTAPPPALPSANQRPPFRTAPPPARPPTNQRPPMHPVLHALLQRQGVPPASFGQHREDHIAADSRPFGLLPLDEGPFSSRMEDILRHMRRLMRTVRPLTRQERVQEMLPTNVSFSRLLGPPRAFAPPRRPPPTRHVPPQMRNFPTQTRSFSPQTRGFSPPAGLRPGPFRRPISVAPPLPNQRSFAPRPPNQRRSPPRGPAPPRGFATPAGGLSHVPPPNQRQIGGGFGGDFGGDRRFQTRHPTTLVGNPQYSYPETATGIQDIIRYIRGKNQPQNGHGVYNGFNQQPYYNPNTRYSSSDVNNNRFRSDGRRAGYNGANDVSAYYHGGSGGIDGYHGGSGGNERYGAPIYPPGYTNQRLSLASSDRPFRLTLDVYPMDDSDRYQSSPVYVGSSDRHQSDTSSHGHSHYHTDDGNRYEHSHDSDYGHYDGDSRYDNGNRHEHSHGGDRGHYGGDSRYDDGNGNRRYNGAGGREHGHSGYSGDSRYDDGRTDKQEIVLHLNLYSQQPSRYGGRASASSRRLTLDIPLGESQLTPQVLYNAVVGGLWRERTNQPHFEFLQGQQGGPSTGDEVGAGVFPVEEAPKILAALEKRLFQQTQVTSADTSHRPADGRPGQPPAAGGDRRPATDGDRYSPGRPQSHGEQGSRPDPHREQGYRPDLHREQGSRPPYADGDRRPHQTHTAVTARPPHAGSERHQPTGPYPGEGGRRYTTGAVGETGRPHGAASTPDQHRSRAEQTRHASDSHWREHGQHGHWYGGQHGQEDRYGSQHGQEEDRYGGQHGQEEDRYGGQHGQEEDRYGGQHYQEDRYGGQHDQEDRYGSVPQASGHHPSFSSVDLVNKLTAGGYLRPDQVSRPPVTSRPSSAGVVLETLPTPLASRHLPLNPAGSGAGVEERSGIGGGSVGSFDFMVAEE